MAETTYPHRGSAGASARAVYEARRFAELHRYYEELQADAAWRARLCLSHPHVGRIIAAGRRPPALRLDPATEAWAAGAEGERAAGAVLDGCPGVAVLHDRARPRSRSNLDHVVVARGGVYVIETKAYNAEVAVYRKGCWPRRQAGLVVAGYDRADLLAAVRDQVDVVAGILGTGGDGWAWVPVVPVACFVGSDWRVPASHAIAEGVVVTPLDGLPRVVRRRGPLNPPDIAEISRRLDRALPPRSASFAV